MSENELQPQAAIIVPPASLTHPKTNETENEEHAPAYVVGLGASAGGLEALEVFFDHMPPDTGMAFVVVQHLSPDYKSLMSEILRKYTAMNIREARHDMVVRPNYIYLTPPRKILTISGGRLKLAEPLPNTTLHMPIDMFFSSLAQECRNQAVAVVMSGTGTDGSRGIQDIKDTGGLVIAQDSHSAKYDGMPSSARLSGNADAVLAPKEMTERLLLHVHGEGYENVSTVRETITTEQYIQLIFEKIRQDCGVDFTYYKRNSVLRRIERRMAIHNVPSMAMYMTFLDEHREELQSLRKDLLIGVTNFFRDSEAFNVLYERVIPELFERKSFVKEIRVWVAGCSTGEEAYSVAILMRKYAESLETPYSIKIFATDLDKESIEYASQGIYSESTISHLSREDQDRFFIKDDDMFQVSKEIRKMVVFAPQNIIKDPPFRNLDLITCRNMLIYLQPEMQQKVLSLFHFALNPDGFLFLGPSETIGRFTNQFEAFDRRWNIFTHKKSSAGEEPRMFQMEDRLAQPQPFRRMVSPVVPAKDSGPKRLDDLQTTLVEEHVAPGMVVDQSNDVIHLNGPIHEYLMLAQGKPSWNLYKMIDPKVSAAVSSAVQKVREQRRGVTYRSLTIQTNLGERQIDLHIRPFSLKNKTYEKYVLILFMEPEQPGSESQVVMQPFEVDSGVNLRIMQLEQALLRAEESLQATVEELETSNEELQATNEELVAANEELQSANEELQSVNEELVTVNTEYQFKIQELTDVNNDMTNFLVSTRIGTIFLDKRMCVRRFTPAITKEIHLMEVDYGRPIEHISHHFKYDTLVQDAQEVLQSLVPFEKEIQSQSGTWYSMRILPYRKDDNFISGVVLTFVNITDLKTVNEELQKLSYAVEQSPSITAILDPAGRIEYVNPRYTEVTGFHLADVKGKSIRECMQSEAGERPIEHVMKLAKEDGQWMGELTGCKKNGELFWESVKMIPVRDKQGRIIHYVKFSEDITDRKHAEEMLRKNEMLSAVGQLAAGVAHEIRNPLTALKGFTKLMSGKGMGNDMYIDIMLNELNRIEQIVSELLVLAKPQAIDFVEKDLTPILQDVLMLLESQANMNNVEMNALFTEGLRVFGVENQLKQVFINILKNAIEAMPSGGRVDVLAELHADQQQIIVQFIDNGTGIPASKLAKLGEPFYSTKNKGTGLGLMVSYKIIQNHKGTIRFESEEGQGTTVTIAIPCTASLLP
ncbi:PAS domain-containing protein [Paenibacillus sp. F411]|uniref:CheR family methyltransferase n=1 Tax=Paenibacillus sp. F411 TaxID=2820239 RepID=UPI001AAF22EE|nr:CheR family methyltransferase [Paenibacillus sp. F411]MBO2946200.1 PAS domain-containing protein [Paenibacillus sp. F411]